MKNLANEIVAWLKDYTLTAKRKALVVGVSGGVDSALVSTLCAMTGMPTHCVVMPTHCVVMPCQTKVDQTDRGHKHIEWLKEKFGDSSVNGVKSHCVDLTDTFQSFHTITSIFYNNELAYANTKSRLRMIALYQVATCVGGLVVGTGNKVEDYHLFFYTKGGDGMVDIAPIGDLMKSEVRQMCRDLGVLPELSEAVPTDGLWDDSRTDESQLGGTYEEFEWAIDFKELLKNHACKITECSPRQLEVLAIYDKWHNAGKHKSLPIPTFRKEK